MAKTIIMILKTVLENKIFVREKKGLNAFWRKIFFSSKIVTILPYSVNIGRQQPDMTKNTLIKLPQRLDDNMILALQEFASKQVEATNHFFY